MGCVGVASWVANIAEEKPRQASKAEGGEKRESEGAEGADADEDQKVRALESTL